MCSERRLILLVLLGIAVPTDVLAVVQPLSEPYHPWVCTQNASTSNFEYSFEKCTETNKIIFKVKITDDYIINVTQPAPAPPLTEPAEQTSTTTTPRSKFPFIHFPRMDYIPDLDGWNDGTYEYEDFIPLEPEATEATEVLKAPEPRRTWTTPAPSSEEVSILTEEELANLNAQFCRESEDEENAPMLMADGAIHPKYEEVLGLGYYRFHTKPRKWEEARRICEEEGAHLVVINSQKEADALLEIHARCPKILPSHFNFYSYIGVHDNYNEGHFETVYGEPLEETGYVKWAIGQPDNAHHYGENCLCMNRRGFFNDVPCDTELPYFCEHE